MKSKSSGRRTKESPCCSLKDLEVHDGQDYAVTTTRNTPYPRIITPKPTNNSSAASPKTFLRLDSWISASASSPPSSYLSDYSSSSNSDFYSDHEIPSPTSSTFSSQNATPSLKEENRDSSRVERAMKKEETDVDAIDARERKMEIELPDAESFEDFVIGLFDICPNVV